MLNVCTFYVDIKFKGFVNAISKTFYCISFETFFLCNNCLIMRVLASYEILHLNILCMSIILTLFSHYSYCIMDFHSILPGSRQPNSRILCILEPHTNTRSSRPPEGTCNRT